MAWWEWVPDVGMVLRMTVARSHGFTPYFLVYKAEPRIPGLADYPSALEIDPECHPDEMAAAIAAKLAEYAPLIHAKVVERLQQKDAYAKSHYERDTQPGVEVLPSPGDMVLVREFRGGKFTPPTDGPYEVVRLKGRLSSIV